MLGAIRHRGPDDEGQWWTESRHGAIGLGNRRLAILDLSSKGHQPMVHGGGALTYNGEVYNFQALRRELDGAGDTIRSATDTEVVLAVLNRFGLKGLARLNGMFALAWWNRKGDELVLLAIDSASSRSITPSTAGNWYSPRSTKRFSQEVSRPS